MRDPAPFLEKLFAAMMQCNIDVTRMELDHLCYRVEDAERYEALRNDLRASGSLLGESVIGSRPIATYRMHLPIQYEERLIDVVELPAPKPGSFYTEGFEHVEFVVEEDLLAFTHRYPALAWDLSGIDKHINADVRLCFEGFSVKFHRQPLVEVIEAEGGSLPNDR